jgi:hypothetical protein
MVLAVLLLALAIGSIPLLRRLPAELQRLRRQLVNGSPVESRLNWLRSNSITGAVLPLDPADSGWLQFSDLRLRPLLDERVELFGSNYGTYSRLCRDVVDDRHNAYRLSDNTLGGWRPPHNVVPFRWVVSRLSDVEPAVRLCSSAHWGAAYWDADVVIFGMKQEAQVNEMSRRLGELERMLRDRAAQGSAEPELGVTLQRVVPEIDSAVSWICLGRMLLVMELPFLARECLERVADPQFQPERDRLSAIASRYVEHREPYTVQE